MYHFRSLDDCQKLKQSFLRGLFSAEGHRLGLDLFLTSSLLTVQKRLINWLILGEVPVRAFPTVTPKLAVRYLGIYKETQVFKILKDCPKAV